MFKKNYPHFCFIHLKLEGMSADAQYFSTACYIRGNFTNLSLFRLMHYVEVSFVVSDVPVIVILDLFCISFDLIE